MLALGCREVAGQLHVDGRIQVAWFRFAGRRHAVTFQAERLAVLRRSRDLQTKGLAGERLHFRFAAECGGGQRNVDGGAEVLALPLKRRMRRETNPQMKVA